MHRTVTLVITALLLAVGATGCTHGIAAPPPTPSATAEEQAEATRDITARGTTSASCVDELGDSGGGFDIDTIELVYDADSSGGLTLTVVPGDGFPTDGVAEFSLDAVNATDNTRFATVYWSMADSELLRIYTRLYRQPLDAVTTEFGDEVVKSTRGKVSIWVGPEVSELLGPNFEWSAHVRTENRHDTCPSSEDDASIDEVDLFMP